MIKLLLFSLMSESNIHILMAVKYVKTLIIIWNIACEISVNFTPTKKIQFVSIKQRHQFICLHATMREHAKVMKQINQDMT